MVPSESVHGTSMNHHFMKKQQHKLFSKIVAMGLFTYYHVHPIFHLLSCAATFFVPSLP